MSKTYLLTIPIILVIGGVFFYLFSNQSEPENVASTCSETVGTKVVVKITEEGFEPSEVNIDRCQKVEWVNETEVERWPASDLHPTHEIYPQFDPRQPIKSGESWSFTFDQSGQWRYHDHLFSINRAKIVVE